MTHVIGLSSLKTRQGLHEDVQNRIRGESQAIEVDVYDGDKRDRRRGLAVIEVGEKSRGVLYVRVVGTTYKGILHREYPSSVDLLSE